VIDAILWAALSQVAPHGQADFRAAAGRVRVCWRLHGSEGLRSIEANVDATPGWPTERAIGPTIWAGDLRVLAVKGQLVTCRQMSRQMKRVHHQTPRLLPRSSGQTAQKRVQFKVIGSRRRPGGQFRLRRRYWSNTRRPQWLLRHWEPKSGSKPLGTAGLTATALCAYPGSRDAAAGAAAIHLLAGAIKLVDKLIFNAPPVVLACRLPPASSLSTSPVYMSPAD
jgi:hypothetical protein